MNFEGYQLWCCRHVGNGVENIDLQASSITFPFSRRELLKFFRNAGVSVKDLIRQFPAAFIVPMNENINATVLVFIFLTPISDPWDTTRIYTLICKTVENR